MIEKLLPINLPPGFVNNGTKYQSKGRWYKGSLVRFYQKTIQPIGGWVQRSLTGTNPSGTPNAMISWLAAADTYYTAIGTTSGVFILWSNNFVANITPAGMVQSATRIWQFDVFGSYLIAVASTKGYAAAGTAYVSDGVFVIGAGAAPTFGADVPTGSIGCVTTPERFLVLLGGEDAGAGVAYGRAGKTY